VPLPSKTNIYPSPLLLESLKETYTNKRARDWSLCEIVALSCSPPRLFFVTWTWQCFLCWLHHDLENRSFANTPQRSLSGISSVTERNAKCQL
jgi:hypothetical protein